MKVQQKYADTYAKEYTVKRILICMLKYTERIYYRNHAERYAESIHYGKYVESMRQAYDIMHYLICFDKYKESMHLRIFEVHQVLGVYIRCTFPDKKKITLETWTESRK